MNIDGRKEKKAATITLRHTQHVEYHKKAMKEKRDGEKMDIIDNNNKAKNWKNFISGEDLGE